MNENAWDCLRDKVTVMAITLKYILWRLEHFVIYFILPTTLKDRWSLPPFQRQADKNVERLKKKILPKSKYQNEDLNPGVLTYFYEPGSPSLKKRE